MAGPSLKLPEHPYYLRSMDASPNRISPNYKNENKISPMHHYFLRKRNEKLDQVMQLESTIKNQATYNRKKKTAMKEDQDIKQKKISTLKKVEDKTRNKISVLEKSNLIRIDNQIVHSSPHSKSKKLLTKAKKIKKNNELTKRITMLNNSTEENIQNVFSELNVTQLINTPSTITFRRNRQIKPLDYSDNDDSENNTMNWSEDEDNQRNLNDSKVKRRLMTESIFNETSPTIIKNNNNQEVSIFDHSKASVAEKTSLVMSSEEENSNLDSNKSLNCTCNPYTESFCLPCSLSESDLDDESWKFSTSDFLESKSVFNLEF